MCYQSAFTVAALCGMSDVHRCLDWLCCFLLLENNLSVNRHTIVQWFVTCAASTVQMAHDLLTRFLVPTTMSPHQPPLYMHYLWYC